MARCYGWLSLLVAWSAAERLQRGDAPGRRADRRGERSRGLAVVPGRDGPGTARVGRGEATGPASRRGRTGEPGAAAVGGSAPKRGRARSQRRSAGPPPSTCPARAGEEDLMLPNLL